MVPSLHLARMCLPTATALLEHSGEERGLRVNRVVMELWASSRGGVLIAKGEKTTYEFL